MIGGNVNEFVDGLYRGCEWWFLFEEKKYFIQGWWENGEATLVLDECSSNDDVNYLWQSSSAEMKHNVSAFLAARLWNGKNFWEAETEMTWID